MRSNLPAVNIRNIDFRPSREIGNEVLLVEGLSKQLTGVSSGITYPLL